MTPKTTKVIKKEKKFDFKKAIGDLEEINNWFQNADIDLDEGLEKLREGKELIAKCQERLAEAENEFVKIKEDKENVDEENSVESAETPLDIALQL
jgi:exodeoxyribonuclease VII small subunit